MLAFTYHQGKMMAWHYCKLWATALMLWPQLLGCKAHMPSFTTVLQIRRYGSAETSWVRSPSSYEGTPHAAVRGDWPVFGLPQELAPTYTIRGRAAQLTVSFPRCPLQQHDPDISGMCRERSAGEPQP